MDRKEFRVGQEYRVCTCGEWHPANVIWCDKCNNMVDGDIHFVEEADLNENEGSAEVTKENATFVCSSCGKFFATSRTVCDVPGCEGFVEPYIQENEDSYEEGECSFDNESCDDLEINKSRYGLKFYRFDNGEKKPAGIDILPVDHAYTFGRKDLYNDERLFFRGLSNDQKKSVATYYSNIQKEHCEFIPKNGRLYVRLTEETCSVRLNGDNKLEYGKEILLRDSDELMIGSRDDVNRKILIVPKLIVNSENASDAIIKELQDMRHEDRRSLDKMLSLAEKLDKNVEKVDRTVERIDKGVEKVDKTVEKIDAGVEEIRDKLSLVDIMRKEGESLEDYFARAKEAVSGISKTQAESEPALISDAEISDEDKIKKFLMIAGADGKAEKNYFGEFNAVKNRRQIFSYFRTAAVFEEVWDNTPMENKDYGDLLLLIGKIFEEAMMVYLLNITYKVNGADFKQRMADTDRDRKKTLDMGFLVRYYNLDKEDGPDHRMNIVRALGVNPGDAREKDYFSRVTDTISILQYAADARNQKGGHAAASENANKENYAKQYLNANPLKTIPQSLYLEIKRDCFTHNVLQNLSSYADKILNQK